MSTTHQRLVLTFLFLESIWSDPAFAATYTLNKAWMLSAKGFFLWVLFHRKSSSNFKKYCAESRRPFRTKCCLMYEIWRCDDLPGMSGMNQIEDKMKMNVGQRPCGDAYKRRNIPEFLWEWLQRENVHLGQSGWKLWAQKPDRSNENKKMWAAQHQ